MEGEVQKRPAAGEVEQGVELDADAVEVDRRQVRRGEWLPIPMLRPPHHGIFLEVGNERAGTACPHGVLDP
jgi:hypothetical protein